MKYPHIAAVGAIFLVSTLYAQAPRAQGAGALSPRYIPTPRLSPQPQPNYGWLIYQQQLRQQQAQERQQRNELQLRQQELMQESVPTMNPNYNSYRRY